MKRMRIEELEQILKSEGFCEDSYSLSGGNHNERYEIDQSNGVWIVYYSERGLKSGKIEFSSESEACTYLLEILRKDKLL